MDIYEILLAAVALIPATVLCCYVYKKDRADKEPIGFLLFLMALGALSAVPVMIASDPINNFIDNFFSRFGTEEGGAVYLSKPLYQVYLFISNTIGIALIEEGFKWIALYFSTKDSKHFNSLFDGVIYAVFVSLGFAALENVEYTFTYGLETGLMRAFTSVPGHMFFGVLMGTYYTMWNVYNEAARLENACISNEIISAKVPYISGKNYLRLSIIFPVLAHGIYDYFCSYPSTLFTVLFYVFLFILYVTQFRRISYISKFDRSELTVANGILVSKYPQLREYFIQQKQELQ